MMKPASILLAAAILFPIAVYGRLGETEQELIARFGVPLSRGHGSFSAQGRNLEIGNRFSFREGDWAVECIVVDGRCAQIAYSKPGDWTEDQLLTVLTANSQGAQWTDVSKEMIKKLERQWRRDDGAAAVWKMGIGMVVTSPAFEREKERIASKAKADASGIPKI